MAGATEIAAAHLFGVCRNLGLNASAQLLAIGVQERAREHRERNGPIGTLVADLPGADAELRELTAQKIGDNLQWGPGRRVFEVEGEPVEVELDSATVELIHALGVSRSFETATDALLAAEATLAARERSPSPEEPEGRRLETESLSGVRVRLMRTRV